MHNRIRDEISKHLLQPPAIAMSDGIPGYRKLNPPVRVHDAQLFDFATQLFRKIDIFLYNLDAQAEVRAVEVYEVIQEDAHRRAASDQPCRRR
jgi:hypothetical protein